MREICVIASGYPYGMDNHCVFVRELVNCFANLGIKCNVIAPIIEGKSKDIPYHYTECTGDGKSIQIYRPRYRHCTSKPGLMRLTELFHARAVEGVIKREKLSPDVLYGHFISYNGLTAVSLAEKMKCKSIIVCGENSHRLEKGSKHYSTGLKWHNWKKKISGADGIICVSGVNRDLLISSGFVDKSAKMCVIPNAVDTESFRAIDRTDARKKLDFPQDEFIAVFVGTLCDRKGNLRVDEALADERNIRTVFIGKGESFTPRSNCLFCGSVKHDELPTYLNAADVFVLPTTGEGCCNAIVEAVCCGLPIISSRDSFNDDILEDSYSIRVNPMNVEEIKSAVKKLVNDDVLRDSMHQEALKAAKNFSIEERARKIYDYIKNV